MAYTTQSWWFRPGRLEKIGRQNPGILSVEDKYEFIAHESSNDKQSWTYVCKYRKTPKVGCPARAMVGVFESKWFMQCADNNHTCEPNRARVTANLLKHRMKNVMRLNPSQSCGEAVRKVRVEAASEYGDDEDFYKHLVAELGTDSAIEKQLLRVKHEIIGPTPRTRNEFDPLSFLERIFENKDDEIVVLDSNLLEENWKQDLEKQNNESRFEWSRIDNLRNIEEEYHQEETPEESEYIDGDIIAQDVTEKNLPKRVLVYTCKKLLKLLSQNKKSSVDGTFKSSCKLWKQQFIWMVKSQGYWIPCAFGWLPDKSEESYQIFFLLIKKKMLEIELTMKVSSVLCDFELNILKAIDEMVGAEIFGCFFHHKDCFRRRVAKKGFKSRYENDEYFHEFINQASGLAHLPIADIEKGLETVENAFEFDDDEATEFKNDFINYIKEFWIEGCIPPVWNVFGRDEDLTNNNQEGYNAKMNREIKEIHPSPGILLSHIRGQIKLSEEKIIRQKAAVKKPAQRKNYKRLAKNRHELKKNYIEARNNNESDAISNFLSAMGHNIATSTLQGKTSDYSETRRDSYVKNGENLDKSRWADFSRDDSTLEAFENPDVYQNRKIGSKPIKPWNKKKCPSCKIGFNSRSNPIKCDGCDSFTHKKQGCLKETKHKNQFYCKICSPTQDKALVEQETQRETCVSKVNNGFKCGKCGLVSKSKYNITRHMERKHVEEQAVNNDVEIPVINKETLKATSKNTEEDIASFLKSIGLEQYENIFKDNHIDVNVLHDLRPEEFMDMAKDLGLNSWAHRHKIKRAIEESKIDKIHLDVENVAKETESSRSLNNTALSEKEPINEINRSNVVNVITEIDTSNPASNTIVIEHDEIMEDVECDLCTV